MSETTAARETPDQALNRALNAAKIRHINEALGICKDVLTQHPEHPGALGLIGGILGQEGRVEEALNHLERAVAKQPNVANWQLNLCALYRSRNRLEDSLRHGQEAVRLAPESASHRVELALTYLSLGDRPNTSRCFREAMACDPELAAPHMGLGELLLAEGDYASGWLEYAWRNKGTLPKMVAAPWNGMKIPGGTLLIVADQGFGDMIQFARYIPMLTARVPNLVIGWGPEVTSLLGEYPGITHCFASWKEAPPHDAYVLLSTLPQIFGTTLDNIPMPIPYMWMKPDRVAAWGERLAAALPNRRLRVGLSWSGRPTHPNNARRSVRLHDLAPILAVPDVDFITLQKPFPADDRAYAQGLTNLLEVTDELTSFAESGALIENLDLVISVDTAVVHLAGALNREVWVLVPMPADWRWLTDREDSVWYKSLRLFRQTQCNEWAPVFAKVASELAARARAFPSQQK